MRQYIIRRVLLSILILFGVSLLLYFLIRMMPGDYVSKILAGMPQVPPEALDNLRKLYGLDESVLSGYINWLGNAIRGDFGVSFIYRIPVSEVMSSKMWTSFWLAFSAFVLQIASAIPLGIISATKKYSRLDYSLTTFSMLGISMPSFFFAAMLQLLFAYTLKILPPSGMVTARADYVGIMHFLDLLWHFTLPVIVLVVISMGSMMRYSRTNMLEVMESDYIRTARAKGLSERDVIYTHAFRNTLIPIVTIVGGSLPGMFAGAMITESIFAIDGIGYTAYKALLAGDIPFIMGYNMFLAVLTLVGTLLSDILYAVVDPRVRYS